MFVESRDQSRQFFLVVWDKMSRQQPLEPLEAMVAAVIGAHPEYHPLLGHANVALVRDFDPGDASANPFLHMGLHVALVEQLQSDRPPGIMALYRRLTEQEGQHVHGLEHRIMECLAAALRRANASGTMPDEHAYLACVRALLR